MTRTGPTKPVGDEFSDGRLKIARGYLKAARDAGERLADSDIGNPIVSLIVLSAIAYADVLTATNMGRVNQKDHRAAVTNLRGALGNRLTTAQSNRLGRILKEKDSAQYGSRATKRVDALRLLQDLEAFAEWAEGELRRLS